MTQERDPLDVAQAALELVRRELRSGPGVVKVSLRDRYRSKSRAKRRDQINLLEKLGMNHNAVARELEVDPTTLYGWYEHGNQRREQIPDWAGLALDELVERMMTAPATGRSGTDG